jgi:hypothetical protein
MACFDQLFEQDRGLLAIGRAQRIELERMLAHGQLGLMGGARHGAVERGGGGAGLVVPCPDLGGV